MASYKLNVEMERAVVRQMLADPTVLMRVSQHVKPAGFEDPAVREIVAAALAFFKRVRVAPTAVAILQEVRDGVTAGRTLPGRVSELAAVIEDARERPPVDSAYVVRKILDVEREAAIWSAIERSIKLHQSGKYDLVLQEVARADAVGKVDGDPGDDYAKTLAARTAHRKKYKAPRRWGTGIVELDDLMDGGLSRDNPLGLFVGGTGAGKSFALDHVAVHHMAIGGYTDFFSLEMGKAEVFSRQDAAIAGVPIKQLHQRADEVELKVADFVSRCRGGIYVQRLPGGRKTCVRDVDARLEQIRMEEGTEPTCIVLDYVGLMAANDPGIYEKRHEELGAVLEEFRELLDKWQCVGWTAAQIKADALEKKNPSVADIAGAFAQSFTADAVVAICRTPEEKLDEKVRLFLAKCRFAADGVSTGPLPSAYGIGRIVAQYVEPAGAPV